MILEPSILMYSSIWYGVILTSSILNSLSCFFSQSTALSSSGVPHFRQKARPGARIFPHFAQEGGSSSRVPQLGQKASSGVSSYPHLAQGGNFHPPYTMLGGPHISNHSLNAGKGRTRFVWNDNTARTCTQSPYRSYNVVGLGVWVRLDRQGISKQTTRRREQKDHKHLRDRRTNRAKSKVLRMTTQIPGPRHMRRPGPSFLSANPTLLTTLDTVNG